MKKWTARILHIVLAAILGFVFASILHTQAVLAELSNIGVSIDLQTRLRTTGEDMLGLAPSYGLVVLAALALAFSVAGLLKRFLVKNPSAQSSQNKINSPKWLYPLAGGIAFLVMLMAMQPILNVTLLAGARGTSGLLMQCIAGVIAGFAFAALRRN